MRHWTVSRRIAAGYALLLSITIFLGITKIIQVHTLKANILDLGRVAVPSLGTQAEIISAIQTQMAYIFELHGTVTTERRTELKKALKTTTDKMADLLRKYELLIEDSEDRSYWIEEVKQNDALTLAIARSEELLARNVTSTPETAGELRNYLQGTLVPAFDAAIKAAKTDFEYNVRWSDRAAKLGVSNSSSAVMTTVVGLPIAFLVCVIVAWKVTSSTNKALQEIASNLDRAAFQTAAAARQVAMASQALSAGASEQAASVEETSASLDEMSSMIRATADNAEKAKTLASEARSVAQGGSRTMMEMTEAMAAIESSSAEVAKIVKNIDEIAFQTNILALNAAVEAARAGEAGAGFAVVADEVRSLAQRSAAAAKETAGKIDAAIANSRKGTQSTTKVEEALNQITEKVSATDQLVADIATAARDQSHGIDQVNNAIAQMDKVTQGNAGSAEESASAAEELDAQSNMLKDLVGQLKLMVGGKRLGEPSTNPGNPHSAGASIARDGRRQPAASIPVLRKGRKSIPMPEDGGATESSSPEHFRDF